MASRLESPARARGLTVARCAAVVQSPRAITFLLFVPPDLQPLAASPDRYIPAEARRDFAEAFARAIFALGSLLAFAAVPAISRRVRRGDDDLLAWTSALAYVGLAALVVTELRRATILPLLGDAYVGGDATLRAAILVTERATPVEPFGWLGFGGVGLWVFVASALAIRRGIRPRALAVVGIAAACTDWLPFSDSAPPRRCSYSSASASAARC